MPRFFLAYDAPHKAKLLATVIPMIVSGALPCHKRPRKYLTPVSQDDLAAMAGIQRSTFTRRLGLFRPAEPEEVQPDAPTEKERKCSSPDSKCRCRGAGHDRKMPREIAGELVLRKRRIAKPNIYKLRLPEGGVDVQGKTEEQLEELRKVYHSPSLADLLEIPGLSDLFADVDNAGGVKDIPEWVWHPNTGKTEEKPAGLTPTARLVMTYYFLSGLGSKHRDTGEMIGEIHPKQPTVAAALGISVKSVYNANRELQDLGGVIRVVQDDCRIEGGRKMRGPAKILYLPLRTMTHDECVAEADRLLKAKERLRDLSWWNSALGIHTALLQAWDGKEHLPGSFNKEFRRRLRDAGAPKHVRDDLAPRSD